MTKETNKKEEILLDCELVGPLGFATFLARLENGHEIVAFTTPKERGIEAGLDLGMRVKVSLSPFDMSKGIIILEEQG